MTEIDIQIVLQSSQWSFFLIDLEIRKIGKILKGIGRYIDYLADLRHAFIKAANERKNT
ncbi:MAG: hypothetical protein R3A45_03825 [Bdellovibrionota bacterium]